MKMTYRITFKAVVIAMLLFVVPLHASKKDDRIVSTAKKSYVFRMYLKGDDIKIESKEGMVTLTGIVSNEYHKSLAKETALALPGVISVDNRLEIKGAAPTANSDAWFEEKVKATLLFHRSVSVDNTEIDVKDGIVTLRGHATSQAQKELTGEYAKDVDGIKEVKNDMQVSELPQKTSRIEIEKIDDTSITAQVKMALWLHRSTSIVNTEVATKHGVVTLGGKAKNLAEKDLVTKLAEDIIGVKKVNNQMVIVPQ